MGDKNLLQKRNDLEFEKGAKKMISREKSRIVLAVVLIFSLLTGCGSLPEEQITVTATQKVIPATDTPIPTPTQTTPPTEVPVLVPRYMLPSVPNFPMEILGVNCNYQGDIWGEKAAFIAYDCPDLNATWLSARFTNLEEGEVAMDLFGQVPSEVNMGVVNSRIGPKDLYGQLPGEGASPITPSGLLSKYDNITILGRVENSEYAYFMVYETESYAISSEVFFPEDTATLEEFYSDNVEKVLHAVLEIMLENTKQSGSSLQPTPMAIDQQDLYNQIAPWLVTMSEANEFYQGASDMFGDSFDGTWVPLGDDVNAERESVCRIFEDRSDADAPLVAFYNCVYIRPDFDLNKLKENFPNSVVLKSAFEYPDQSIIYGHKLNNGHTSLNAFILQDEYLIYIFVESRTLMGHTPEDVFEGFNDDFIYNVLMTNLEHYSEGSPPTSTPVTKTFTIIIPANELWFNTGVEIIKGQDVAIRATGIVNTWDGKDISNSDANGQTTAICDNTGCPMPGAYYGELIGKLDGETPFRVGSSLDFTAPESGVLFLIINDWIFDDNSGEFSVVVTIK